MYRERTEHQRFTVKLDDILYIVYRDVYIFNVLFIYLLLIIKIMSTNSGVLDLLWWAVTWLFYNVVSKVSTLVYDIVIKFISAVACLHNLLQPPVRTVPRKITYKSATSTRVVVEGGTGLKWCYTRLNI